MTKNLRLRLQARDQRGLTLSELVVTVLILSIVMIAALDFLDRTSLLTFRTDAHARAEQETQQALRTITQHTRGAYPVGDPCTTTTDTPPAATGALTQGTLPAGYNNCLQFSVPRTAVGLDACARTDFVFALVPVTSGGTVVDTYLVENRRENTGTTGACTTGTWRSRRILMKNVANDGTQPLFTYYAADGSQISVANTAAIKKAKSLKVTLANRFRKTASPLVMTGTVALRNNISR